MPYFNFGFDVRDERLNRVVFPDFEVAVEVSQSDGHWTVDAVYLGEVNERGELSKDAVELTTGEAMSRRLWADAQAAAQKSIDDHGRLWAQIEDFLLDCEESVQAVKAERAEYYADMRGRV